MTSSPRLAQALILALNSHKGLKEVLEILYIWLIDLSLGCEFGSNYTNKVVCRGFSLNLESVQSISRILFKELSERFEVSSDNSLTVQPQTQHGASPEEIVMLLRCCVASVNLLDDDQSLLLEGCLVLRKLLFVLYSYGDNEGREGCTTLSHIEPDVRTHLVRRLLEVYVDQLIKHKTFSKYITLSARPSSVGYNMCQSDFGYVQRAISAHFLLSVSGAQTFEHFLKNLVWSPKENHSDPEVSLYAAVSLLICPSSASVSTLLRAHIISMVSDAISTTSGHDNMGLSHKLISCYLPAFEKSVNLYHTQLSKLELRIPFSESNDSVAKSSVPVLGRHRGFRACIPPMMTEKLDSMIEGLDFSPCLNTAINTEMVDVLSVHVNENLHLFDKSCTDVASRFLRFLIRKAYPAESDDAIFCKYKNPSPEDLCLFASILKLMSSSLLQVVLSLHKTSRDSLSCKEYEILIDTVNSFGLYKMQLPIQALIHENLEAHCSRTNGSKLIFVHLTGLLSLFLACGLQLLAEGCLSVIMVLMNLLYLEEGSLGFLSQLDGSPLVRRSPRNHLATPETTIPCSGVNTSGTQEALQGNRRNRSSVGLASKFRKIQMCTMRKGTTPGLANDEVTDVEVEDETCNGTIFFECLNKQRSGMASFAALDEELVDFVQCKRGKDYGAWLKNRMRYKKRKSERLAIQSWGKKRSAWRSGRRRNPGMK